MTLLNYRIWDHLVNIACHNGKQTTIIMTTHYIEEARQADKVFTRENIYSKTCLKQPLKLDKTKILMTNGSLMKVERLGQIKLVTPSGADM